mgnify:CR=1 FL=1
MYFQHQFYIQDGLRVKRSSSKNLLSCHLSPRLGNVGEKVFIYVCSRYVVCPGTGDLSKVCAIVRKHRDDILSGMAQR